jgi:hypothetical protein
MTFPHGMAVTRGNRFAFGGDAPFVANQHHFELLIGSER